MSAEENKLLDLLSGEIPEVEATRLEEELSGAERTELGELREVVDLFREGAPGIQPPPTLRRNILKALDEEIEGEIPWGARLFTALRWAAVGAAALVVGGLFYGYSGMGAQPAPPPPRVEMARVRVATVLASAAVESGEALASGREVLLTAGQQVELDWKGHGLVRLTGPGRAVIQDWSVELTGGKLYSEVDPPDDRGFQVLTPDAIVSVVGTRFEVVHESEKGSRVEVFEGRVKVLHRVLGMVRFLSPTEVDGARWELWEAKLDGAEPPVTDIRLVDESEIVVPATADAGAGAGTDGAPVAPGRLPGDPLPPPLTEAGPDGEMPPVTDPPAGDESEDSDAESGDGEDTEGDEEPPDPSELPADTVVDGF